MSVIIETHNIEFMDKICYPEIQVKKNSTVFVCGKSGAGKSTLLKLFNKTADLSKGNILYNNKDISKIDSVKLRQEILLISQSVFLFSDTIENNFKLFYEYRDQESPTNSQMKEYLNLCAIDFSLDTDCSKLSGGEKQRVYIAIFLSFLPKIILLDEPTSALDEKSADRMLSAIINFCKEKEITRVIISHNTDLALKYADEIINL